MRRFLQSVAAVALAAPAVLNLGCSPGVEAEPPPGDGTEDLAAQAQAGPVTGTIRGTEVALARAEFDGNLAIYEGEGWGYNPSLLLFLFFEKGEIPAGRTIEVGEYDPSTANTPHVHYRWRDGRGDVQAEARVDGYRMRLSFGEPSEGVLPGTIELSVPGEATVVSGAFLATIAL